MQSSTREETKTVFSVQSELQRFPQRMIAGSVLLAAVFSTVSLPAQTADPMFIDKQGQVGLGTNQPGAKLDVNGNAVFRAMTTIMPNSAGLSALTLGDPTGKRLQVQYKLESDKNRIGFAGGDGSWKFWNEFETGNAYLLGNLGIGAATPGFPLSFPDKLGDKISLWGQSGNNYGFGIQNGRLQIHSDASSADIVFGYGKSDGMTETVRMKGNGNVGVGTATPGFPLSFPDKLGDKISLWGQSGNNYGLGIQGSQLQIHTDVSGGDIVFGYGKSDSMTETMRIKGNKNVLIPGNLYVSGMLAYFWGPDNRWKKLENKANNFAGSYDAPAPSDLRLKKDLQSIPSPLDKIHSLRGVTYRWNGDALRYLTRDIENNSSAGPDATAEENQKLWQKERDDRYKELSGVQVGVVAQDVEAVLPEAVTTDDSGYKLVKYDNLIPLLVEALKEEDTRSQEQQAEIQRLTAANKSALQQLTELEEMKQKLARVEASMNRFMAAERSGERKEISNASPSSSAGVLLSSR